MMITVDEIIDPRASACWRPRTSRVAHNYHPLDVVVATGSGRGAHRRRRRGVPGLPGRLLGHQLRPRPPGAAGGRAEAQLGRVTLTSRAFHHDQLAPFADGLTRLIGKEMMLPMNTGAEAVESGIKVARKWGYEVKGVPDGRAKIIVAAGNFHGRTTTIISFSDDPLAHDHFGPYTPGLHHRAVRRPGRAGGRDHRRGGRGAARTDPGRGRRAASRRRATWPGYAS